MRFLVITEIFVLSDERITPKTVVPVGSASCKFSQHHKSPEEDELT